MTTSKIILKVLEAEPNKWFKSFELNQQSTRFGWIGSAGSRRARELAESGAIEVKHGKYAEYRHIVRVYVPSSVKNTPWHVETGLQISLGF